MPALLRMPGVAANATDAVLAEWQVAENAEFDKDEAIATVETDKANVDIEAEEDGVILKYLVTPGATVEVGAPIALTGHVGEKVSDLDQALLDLGIAAEENFGADEADMPVDTTNSSEKAVPTDESEAGADRKRLFATPLVRRLARDAGLDLDRIVGTGVNGRIVKRDITDLLTDGSDDVAPTAPEPAGREVEPAAPEAAAREVEPAVPKAGYTDTPQSRMRMAIASRLTRSKQDAPHFYLRGAARIDELLALRATLNEIGDIKISVNDLVLKAAARAHVLVPAMNVIWLDDAVRSFDNVDISVAVASDRGLMTPVVRDVGRRGIAAVAEETRNLAERAREGKLKQDELEGGSLSISNLGMFGTEEFSAIINPPQAAILAVGAARTEPVVRDRELAVASVLKVTLSVDHRAVDGAVAAEWMAAFLGVMENPLKILM